MYSVVARQAGLLNSRVEVLPRVKSGSKAQLPRAVLGSRCDDS